jgi:hypothetical protein
MGQETQQPSTAALKDNANALLTQFNVILGQLNTALTALAVSNIVPSPTVVATQASIAAVTV